MTPLKPAWLIIAGLLHFTVGATVPTATPLSIPPSEFFEGVDGKWSTFFVQVGTPPQALRLLPGTSASAGDTVWVVLPEECTEANPGLPGCFDQRHVFYRNESTTWSTNQLANDGLYALNTVFVETLLGLNGNAFYGFDTVQLGVMGDNLPSLTSQVVAGIATNNYWLGSLPLSPLSFNFTSINQPYPSMLGTLRNRSFIPSTTWGYTAGASYRDPVVYGSLTLGGYDNARYAPNALQNIAFGADQSRDLEVQLRSITYDTLGSSPLLARSYTMFVDSMVAQLWLPIDVCEAFERAFNITWNPTLQLYLIDDDVHDTLVAQNPTFTFTLGAGNETIDIVLPYAAFDLEISQPYNSNGTSRYFPLKRAQNSSQYILGRVFLQEAYVIADYDRQNFTLGQAVFPSSGEQDLQAILPPGLSVTEEEHHVLSTGAIVGIAVGSGVALLLFIVGMVILHRYRIRRRNRDSQMTLVASQMSSPLTDKNEEVFQPFGHQKQTNDSGHFERCPGFTPDIRQMYETDGRPLERPELDGEDQYRYEIGSDTDLTMNSGGPYELEGREAAMGRLSVVAERPLSQPTVQSE